MSDDGALIDFYPYRSRFKTYHRLEPAGRERKSILEELATMAAEEDRTGNLGGLILVLVIQPVIANAYISLGLLAVIALLGLPVVMRLPARAQN